MTETEEAHLLRRSGLFDSAWYLCRYPDVVGQRMDPLQHFMRIGAELGRDPGPGFSSRYYLAENPDVAAAGLVPVLHYLKTGQTEGRLPHPPAQPRLPSRAIRRLQGVRALLETGGLTEEPLQALAALATGPMQDATAATAGAGAAEALAFWALRTGDGAMAGHWLARRLEIGADAAAEARLTPARLIAYMQAGDEEAARALYCAAPENADLHLAATWLCANTGSRLEMINRAFALSGLRPIGLADGDDMPFDRLQGLASEHGTGDDAPLVSIIVAAHNAATTIKPALDSLIKQNWHALEIVVVDDASHDQTPQIVERLGVQDKRIRLIKLEQNRGAYAARNAGLAAARGQYVTLHDADDWAHPERITRQVQFLHTSKGHAGCLGLQMRCDPGLRVSRWTGTGAMQFEGLPTLMLPKALVQRCLGGWDEVRASADSELLRRVRLLFGAESVRLLTDGPLMLQRDHADSATADGATGMEWFYFGARREYFEAQQAHHAKGAGLFYAPRAPRPFAAPNILRGNRGEQQFDHIYAGLLSAMEPALDQLLHWLDEDAAQGLRSALVPLYSMAQCEGDLAIAPRLRARIDGQQVQVLCYGERARCRHFRQLPGQHVAASQRYLPEVFEEETPILWPGACPDQSIKR